MAKQYPEINDRQQQFIEAQKIFFVGTATADGRVNVSPKGMDSLRVLGGNRVAWLNVTGSGNETSAHVQENPRMTIMFAAFEGNPMIMRLYGTAKVIHRNDPEWAELLPLFDPIPGARQIFDLDVDIMQTSCGTAVPFFDFVAEREQLNASMSNRGEAGVKAYWAQKNQVSIDGKPTNIVQKNT